MTDAMQQGRNRELVLPPGTYAFVLDSTKGKVSAYVGPFKNSLSDTDQLVVWDAAGKRYTPVNTIEDAKQVFTLAGEGQYIVLTNPAADDGHPHTATANDAVELEAGKRVIVPGPATFPLWPGQTAQTIDGHHLRHNQYVLVRVYDEDEARDNWESAIMAPQVSGTDDSTVVDDSERIDSSELTMGQLFIVPGTQVSFYMPSTGLEVVREEGGETGVSIGSGKYVRDAATLETLEYVVLLDENGQKRYLRGPAVVFPRPTESFRRNKQGGRNFQAIELDERSGLYVKVIEEYTENSTVHPVGEELFITGKEQSIYFPRPEHSIITYGEQRKHHAIAIPAGEGRYVLDRKTGQVNLERGPAMFLPDPRYQVVVRRILDPHDVSLMYPGNSEALQVNRRYQQEAEEQEAVMAMASATALPDAGTMRSIRGLSASSNYAASTLAGALPDVQNFGGDAMSRSTTYRGARTITLDTKYEGAVALNIWPGYAVLVTNKTGDRRVEMGPRTVLLEYDETIMALALSTGRPKNDENLLRTGYLRVLNNVVSDRILVETRDLVRVAIGVSYRVNFIGDELEWFSLENYVQALTDHCRSRLRNAAKQFDIRSFYLDTINIVRDTLLKTATEDDERPGLTFTENGMHVYDVEVLSVDIQDQNVAALLTDAQGKALAGAIQLSVAEDSAVREARLQELQRESLLEHQVTWVADYKVSVERMEANAELQRTEQTLALGTLEERAKVVSRELEIEWDRFALTIDQLTASNVTDMERLVAETSEFVRRLNAVTPDLIKAIEIFGDQTLTEKIVTAIGPAAMAAGTTTSDILLKIFKGTPLEAAAATLAMRPLSNSALTS